MERKAGGVYYTRSELVDHLVKQAVLEPFLSHLEEVRQEAVSDPIGAAHFLFEFAVLDPACGSGHFLVQVVDGLADLVVRFLAATPLPQVAEMLDHLRAGAASETDIPDRRAPPKAGSQALCLRGRYQPDGRGDCKNVTLAHLIRAGLVSLLPGTEHSCRRLFGGSFSA